MVNFKDHLASHNYNEKSDPTKTKLQTTSSFATELNDVKNQYRIYAASDPALCKQLRTLHFGEVMIVKIIDKLTLTKAYKLIFQDDPYHLMKVDGIGFTKADLCAKQLGIKNEDPRRQRALIRSVLESNATFGNVYLPTTVLEKECKRQQVHKFQERLNELIESREVVLDGNRIYLCGMFLAEVETANYIRTLLGKDENTNELYLKVLSAVRLTEDTEEDTEEDEDAYTEDDDENDDYDDNEYADFEEVDPFHDPNFDDDAPF